MIHNLKKAFSQGIIVTFLYLIVFMLNDYLHVTNLKISNTDFYIDVLKKISKYDEKKLINMPVYVVEITDADIAKYHLNGYAIPKWMISKIIQKYSSGNAKVLFLDLDISRSSSIETEDMTSIDQKMVNSLNNLSKPLLLPKLNIAPLYNKLHNSNISFVSVQYLVNDSMSVQRYLPQINGIDTVAYNLFKRLTNKDTLRAKTNKFLFDPELSNIIIFKEFNNENSYYSGLSKISLSRFLEDKNHSFEDAILMLGRIDKDAHDIYKTSIGVMPGIYINANALMSMFYYGKIRSYLFLNIFSAFILGFVFSLIYETFREKTELSEVREDLIAWVGIVIFSVICLFASYMLLENFSFWLDYQKVVFAFTIYEGIKILKDIPIRRRNR